MGQGGRITLINGTPHRWKTTQQSSYQMETWDFKHQAEFVDPGQAKSVYVEWKEGAFNTEKDDSGDAKYVLEGTPFSFWIQARAQAKEAGVAFSLRVHFADISVYGNPQGSVMTLGWKHNGHVHFILTGSEGNFSSNTQPTAWMQHNLSTLGNQTLRQLCIPGSHNSGMSVINGNTAFIHKNNVICQSETIGRQLELGWRYFDIRPTIRGSHYYTGHYSKIDQLNSWQGANGQSLTDIINDINNFTAKGNNELIILNVSHDYDTDLGNENYAPFTQTKWDNFFARLTAIKHLFYLPTPFVPFPAFDPKTVDLTTLSLKTFIDGKKPAIVIVFEPNDRSCTLGSYHTKGFYNHQQLGPYNNYSNSNNTDRMIADQITKMKDLRPNPNHSYFLLSWTLTQDAAQVIGSIANEEHSILSLAKKANPLLFVRLLAECTRERYPNILYVDDIKDQLVTALALVINNRFARPA